MLTVIRWGKQMVDADLTQLIALVLIALAIGVLAFTLLFPYLSGEKATERRIATVTEKRPGGRPRARTAAGEEPANSRKKAVADTLKDLDDRQSKKQAVPLRVRIERAGLDITPGAFWVASGICGLLCGIGFYFSAPNLPAIASASAVFVGGFGLPRWVLAQLTKRRQNAFLEDFASSIDVIVRGVKSGLPLNECLGIIAREANDPIRTEFQEVCDQSRVGVTIPEAFERMTQRMPLSEVRFFAIVIAIQQQAGGNLSEALGNLSGVLRDRKTMNAKVKALSAEAKASAAVLGSLPFIVMSMVYLSTPKYIAYLFNTTVGNFMLAGAAIWMTCGILVMRKMINFKF
jgi:tight adherence protein B